MPDISEIKKNPAYERLVDHLPEMAQNIQTVKKLLQKDKITSEEVKIVLKDLEKLKNDCDLASLHIKTYDPKDKKSDVFKELQKIKLMLASLQDNPVMQVRQSEMTVTVFWQVMNDFFEYIDEFERASKRPKRNAVEKVSNEKLDKK